MTQHDIIKHGICQHMHGFSSGSIYIISISFASISIKRQSKHWPMKRLRVVVSSFCYGLLECPPAVLVLIFIWFCDLIGRQLSDDGVPSSDLCSVNSTVAVF